jgi:hypothetical protein
MAYSMVNMGDLISEARKLLKGRGKGWRLKLW